VKNLTIDGDYLWIAIGAWTSWESDTEGEPDLDSGIALHFGSLRVSIDFCKAYNCVLEYEGLHMAMARKNPRWTYSLSVGSDVIGETPCAPLIVFARIPLLLICPGITVSYSCSFAGDDLECSDYRALLAHIKNENENENEKEE